MIHSTSLVAVTVGILIGRCLLQPVMYAPWPAVTAESFDVSHRYTGASLGYQLSSLIGGGFAPLIASSLYVLDHKRIGYVALFVATSALLTTLCIWRIAETRETSLAARDSAAQREGLPSEGSVRDPLLK